VIEYSNVLGLKVGVTSINDVCETVVNWCRERDSRYISVSNVHMCMEAFDSPTFQNIVNRSDLVVPDGRPLYWFQKIKGHVSAKQVRGVDLTLALCERAEIEGISIGFYGSTNDVLSDLEYTLFCLFPKIKISYIYSPPFRPLSKQENKNVQIQIKDSGCQLLFVGLGCPNQEKWMGDQKDILPVTMVGVGAAFDFIAGNKSSAPKFMQRIGLEWLYRLAQEPGRLWRRYLIQNSRFTFLVLKELLFK